MRKSRALYGTSMGQQHLCKHDPIHGRIWSWDSIYWSRTSKQGNKYSICGRDSNTGYCHTIHMPYRIRATELRIEAIQKMRKDPELNNPLICTFILRICDIDLPTIRPRFFFKIRFCGLAPYGETLWAKTNLSPRHLPRPGCLGRSGGL